MTRKTFFRTLVRHGLRLCGQAASFRDLLCNPGTDTESPLTIDDLYQEAMRLGIDPASMDNRRLREIVSGHRADAARQAEIQNGKGGDNAAESVG